MSLARAMELFVDSDAGWTLVVLDETGVVTSWGRAAEGLTGHDGAGVLGRHISVIYEDPGEIHVLLRRALAGVEAVEARSHPGTDRSRRWTTMRINAQRDERSQTVSFLVLIVEVPEGPIAVPQHGVATTLLDTVVHPLFAAGLELDGLSTLSADQEIRRRVAATMARLDEALRNLRIAVADLTPPSTPL